MTIRDIHNNFSGGELDPKFMARYDTEILRKGAKTILNGLPMSSGGITKRPGTKYIAGATSNTTAGRMIPFIYSSTIAYALEFGDLVIHFFYDGAQVQSGGSALSLVSPYAIADLADIKYHQIADVMYLTHPDYPVKWLYRTTATDWTIENVPFVWGPFLSENDTATTITPSAITGSVTLTASAALFNSNNIGGYFKISGSKITSADMAAATNTVGPVSLETGESVVCSLSGTWVGTVTLQRSYDGSTWLDYIAYTSNNSIEITALEDTQYRWYFTARTSGTATGQLTINQQSGYAQITAITSDLVVTATVIETLPSTSAVTTWSEGAFSVRRGYPNACRFYEQRLELMGTEYAPLSIWGSKVDDFVNFDTGVGNDDDAYLYTLAGSQINLINWAVDSDILFLGTTGGAWKFGDPSEPTTPTSVYAKIQSSYGTADIQGLLIGGAIYYLETGATRLRFSEYDYRPEKWVPHNLSQRAEHLLKNGVKELHFQSRPDNILWLVRDDGYIVSCTIDMDNQVIAFAKHETEGLFESMCVIPGSDRDECWFRIVRSVDGSTVRYIEQMQGVGDTDGTLISGLTLYDLDDMSVESDPALTSLVGTQTPSTFLAATSHQMGSLAAGNYYEAMINFDTMSGIAYGDTVVSAVMTGFARASTLSYDLEYSIHCEDADIGVIATSYSEFVNANLTVGVPGVLSAHVYSENDPITYHDFSAALQEVIDRPGYVAGNAISVYFKTYAQVGGGCYVNMQHSAGHPFTLTVVYKTKTGELLTIVSTNWDSFNVDSGLTFWNWSVITGITAADPAVVTSAGHGFTDGMTVELSQVEGMTEINGETGTVANATANTFELSDIDSTAFTAYTGGGVAEQLATTISGAGHLEGEAVSVLADNLVVTGKTVASGAITLATAAKKVHLGLSYNCDIEPVLWETSDQQGVSHGRRKSINLPVVNLLDSYGLKIGPDASHLKDYVGKFTAGTLKTDDIYCDFLQGYDLSKAKMYIRNDLPTPFTILSVSAAVTTSEV